MLKKNMRQKIINPEIVVLIPHYNNLKGLTKTLKSISSIEPVDVLIIDDGSLVRPNLNKLIKDYEFIHKMNIIFLEKNQGIEVALNTGLEYILKNNNYKYVARIDTGDIAAKDRFKIQKKYFEKHKDVYLVGTWANVVDMDYNLLFVRKLPTKHKQINRYMYLFSSFIHPSVMFKVEALKTIGLYPTNYKYNEDDAFFFKFINNFKTANINKALTSYNINPKGISQAKYRESHKSSILLTLNNFNIKYLDVFIVGLTRRIICWIFGPKIMTKVAILLGKNTNYF